MEKTQENLTPDGNNLVGALAWGKRHDPRRHRLHDVLILDRVAVAIVDVGGGVLLVVRDAVHRIAAKAQTSHPRKERPPQIMRRRPLDLELGDDCAHRLIETAHRSSKNATRGVAIAQPGDDLSHRRAQPYAVALT